MKLSILFVDDDENIISGLRRIMHSQKDAWSLFFAEGGNRALEILSQENIDVIISDIRMPGLDGNELLKHVKENYPQILRITLSGFANDSLSLNNTRIVHQSLLKPTTADQIKTTIERAQKLRIKLNNEELISIINGIEELPSLPEIYIKLEEEANSKDSSIDRISKIISEDPNITLKILQLTNSAFFGLPNKITNIKQALNFLGIKLVQNLVLSIKLFRSINPNSKHKKFYHEIWNHSNKVAQFSQKIAKAKNLSKALCNDSYLAGLLHDIGKIILIEHLNENVKSNSDYLYNTSSKFIHADVGAYLLGIWGLPDSIVESVAYHHDSDILKQDGLNTPIIVYIANNLVNNSNIEVNDINETNVNDYINIYGYKKKGEQLTMYSKILLVDDDENVLSGYSRNLKSHFETHTAKSGTMGIELINKNGPYSVVVSDFKMPEMNGNHFLAKVKELSPDTVRIMLTGYADLPTTIEAVNSGNIYRLLTKPCSVEKLIKTINDGIKQHRLLTAEKELLDKTLKGTIKVLIDILSTVNPPAFSRISRFQKYLPTICNLLNIKDKWELEIATLLSQIGLVIMPADLLEKKFSGGTLTIEQEQLFNSHPFVGKTLLSKIPRLENIAEAINYQFYPYEVENSGNTHLRQGEELPIISRILKVLNEFDNYVLAENSEEAAFVKLKINASNYDPNVIIALDAAIAGVYEKLTLCSLKIDEIIPGCVAASDIKDKNGQVLITKGAEITEMLKMKLLNFSNLGHVNDEIKVLNYVE